MTSTAEFLTAHRRIQDSFRDVMKHLDAAVSHEEHEDWQLAVATYCRCERQIEDIFAIQVGLPENIDDVQTEWKEACTTIQKLKELRSNVAYRLNSLRAQHSPLDDSFEATEELQDSASATTQQCPKLDIPKTYREIIGELRRVIASKECAGQVLFDTLFESQAQLYKIQPNGATTTMAGKTSMSLVMCTTTNTDCKVLNGICFIQCAIPLKAEMPCNSSEQHMIWIYPLIPKVTNCYRTNYSALILADLESDVPGNAFGLMLSQSLDNANDEEKLNDLEGFFFDLLEAILTEDVGFEPEPNTSQTISNHVVTAADFIARNLVKGAEKTGEMMVRSTPYLISKISAAPTDAAPVSSGVQKSVEVAKNVSTVAAGVTGWVAGKVGTASLAIGRFMAPHIQRQGAVMLQKGFGYDTAEANSTMEGVFTIAAGAVEGFATVYNGLETSAKILGKNLSENSVKIIEHGYGPSTGNVAAGTFETIGNAFNVSQNVNCITPKGFAKKLVKNTGKAVVLDHKRKLREESQFVDAKSLYPDLRILKEQNQ